MSGAAQVAHITLAKPGERVNGDAVFVRRDGADRLVLAVIDGLGHGPIAAEASQAAVACLASAGLERSVLELMQMMHAELRGTRGAAATVCVIRGAKLETCAVGNVQLSSSATMVPLVLSSGVLGQRVAKFRVCEAELKSGTRLALFSDGISSRLRLEEMRRLVPEQACKQVIEQHRKLEDDATILIADMDG